MDGSHFDTLTKSVAGLASRRQALGGLLIASLALLGGAQPEETAAHNAKKKCRKREGDAKKRCLKRARKHNRRHATETTIPTGGTVVTPPTCSDAIKNGNETDVDCGGPDCPRCADGKACLVTTDCATGSCFNHVCQD